MGRKLPSGSSLVIPKKPDLAKETEKKDVEEKKEALKPPEAEKKNGETTLGYT